MARTYLLIAGFAITLMSLVLGLMPVAGGYCAGTALFHPKGEVLTPEGPTYCFTPDGTGYWIGLIAGVAIIVAGLVTKKRD